MVEQGDAFEQGDEVGLVSGVGTVGVAARGGGGACEPAVGDDGAVGQSPVGAVFDVVELADGYAVVVGDVAADVWQGGFFLEEKSAAWHAVVKGQGVDADGAVVVDAVVEGGVDGVEDDAVFESLAEDVELPVEEVVVVGGGIDVEVGGAAEQPEGRNQSDESQAVVAVEVGDEDVAQVHEAQVVVAHLQLRAFTAIDE